MEKYDDEVLDNSRLNVLIYVLMSVVEKIQ